MNRRGHRGVEERGIDQGVINPDLVLALFENVRAKVLLRTFTYQTGFNPKNIFLVVLKSHMSYVF